MVNTTSNFKTKLIGNNSEASRVGCKLAITNFWSANCGQRNQHRPFNT